MKRKIVFFGILLAMAIHAKAQWQDINLGANTSDVIGVILATHDTIYAGGEKMYRSKDDGITWDSINNGFPVNNIVMAIAKNGNNLFMGSIRDGIFRSTDNGNSWDSVNTGLHSHQITAMITRGNIVFAATKSGMYISSDNGQQWNQINNGLTNSNINFLAVIGSRILAAASNILFFTDNNGLLWNPSNMPDTLHTSGLTVSNNKVFAATDHGVFMSTDSGINWQGMNNGLPVNDIVSITSHGSMVFAGKVFSGSGSLYFSPDGANSWFPISGCNGFNVWSLGTSDHSVFAGMEPPVFRRCLLSQLVGVTELSVNSNISIYPNPSFVSFTISFQSENPVKTELILSDMQGNMLLKQHLNETTTKIDISGLNAGVYFCRVFSGKEMVKCEKIVKAKNGK